MRCKAISFLLFSVLYRSTTAQSGPYSGGWGGNFAGSPSCAESCAAQFSAGTCSGPWGTCICTDSTVLTSVNTCIASSSCSNSDKDTVNKQIAFLCASTGNTITSGPQASYTSFISSWSATGPWSPVGTVWGTNSYGGEGWRGPWSKGPFGQGPWTTGGWTTGDWTSWWDGGKCPPKTWEGWTSGSWKSKPEWTFTVVSTKTDAAGSVAVVTETSLGIKVVEQTAATVTGSNSAVPTTNSTEKDSGGVKKGVLGMEPLVVAVLGMLLLL
ncbi:hypothetical protein B0O99DRAFT_600732 [Bisporella sp. PMI_857]|nr:hypothetical protein B0O99DRAFT_600732 [Bisporella sp. PMI_857]